MMEEVYKNRKKEINDVVNFIFSADSQILLYESAKGIGNTSFISRVIYIMQATSSVQLFNAELSIDVRNPIHAITNGLSSKNNQLYYQLQMFTDKEYGTYEMPLLSSFIKDISQSDTLAALFQPKSALPIYAGFYQSRLKEIFFILVNEITKAKTLVIFIDNIQFIDNESIYELQALLNNPKVKIVCSKSDIGENFEKFYLETKYKYTYTELFFPLPNISYVKKLGEIYHKNVSDKEADMILFKSGTNIRKILFHLREPLEKNTIDSIKLQILKIIYLYNDFITSKILLSILEVSPYKNVFPIESILTLLNTLENEGFFKTLIDNDGRNKSYRIDSFYIPKLDIADRLIISKCILTYYKQSKELSYHHLLQAWDFAVLLNDEKSSQQFAVSIIKSSLQMGYVVNEDIISTALTIKDKSIQLLVAVFFFCNARYKQAKKILDNFISDNTSRAINVIYAITLNRCREHQAAQEQLWNLINTCSDVDELAILISFLISNDVHSGKLEDAINVYQTFDVQLKISKKYPYFLRNAATIFEPSKAYRLRHMAKCIFKKNGDLFGYYTTIINMTSYNLKNTPISFALNQALIAFEALQQFGASQIHLAANNLGICYLMNNNYIEAIKYLTLSIEVAKTIMPIGYATFNLAAIYIKIGETQTAYKLITNLKQRVLSSNLPRLKGRYYLSMAVIEYVFGNYGNSQKFSQLAIKDSNFAPSTKPYSVVAFLNEKCNASDHYESEQWENLYAPCFLEYWTINSIDILADELLSF
jgi:tetratricopeptide (TPR) repeat protein